MEYNREQMELCNIHDAPFVEAPSNLKVGIASNVRPGAYPINGLRHPIEGDTSGWYIWVGDFSSDPDFFKPLHIEHLPKLCPDVMKYLGLGPGWRFLLAPDYDDVWEDKSLLDCVL